MSARRIAALLLAFLLLLVLFGCEKSGQGNENPQPAPVTDFSPDLPDGICYISILRYENGTSGRAAIPRENLGVIRQLVDETTAAVLTPLASTDTRTFEEAHCFDLCFYTEAAALTIVSVDQNGLVLVGGRLCTLRAGTITYDYIESYYNAFFVE